MAAILFGTGPRSGLAGVVLLMVALASSLALAQPATGRRNAIDLTDRSRLRVGIGDRAAVLRDGEWVSTVAELDRHGIAVDMLQLWLPKGWKPGWIDRARLREMSRRGITPVVVHYYFGDDISKERVEAQRDAWYSSMWEMARRLKSDHPVMVILEPEFNIAPPRGETAITDWPWFAKELRAAVKMIRDEAPNVLIGTCPGDFAGPPNLEAVLGPVADDLDFIAFQEMRADTAPDRDRKGMRPVGVAAVEFARYLKRAFNRPLLLGYLAVSSHGGWEDVQRQALRDIFEQRAALLEAGVWGFLYFQLYDDPAHRGYFGRAERHFGLVTHDGRAKPALGAFRALARP